MAEFPKYKQVQNALHNLIISGVYKAGDLLPTEHELSAQFGITRMTIRNALKSLEDDGLIARKQGSGSMVMSKRKSVELLSINGFTKVMEGNNVKVESRLIKKPHLKPWPESFFYELNSMEKQAGCIQLDRVRSVEGEAIMYEITYFANLNIPKFCQTPFVNGSLFDTLKINHNIEMLEVKQKFRAIKADSNYSNLLSIDEGEPLLHIIRKLTTNRPHLNIYSSVFFNSSNHFIEI
jgi:DNA-binding GntR family transcriptional regulator